MTAIAIWFNDENPDSPSLWVAADSRVSKLTDVGHSGHSTLIDDAAKVFTLPVICKYPGENGLYSRISHYQTYGYCFAGNTLLGQNSFLSIMPLLSNLIANEKYIPPMNCVAEFIYQYLSRSFDEYKVIACNNSAIEVALFGWCHANQKYYIFHYYPSQNEEGEYKINCITHTDLTRKSFIYLGDEKDDLEVKIKEGFNKQDIADIVLSRTPQYVIETHIQNHKYPSIGGDLQLGIANQYGFQPYLICKPRVFGKPEAYLSYLGYELHQDIKNVGYALVGLPGMI
ncbi:hypothetical protein [Trichormus sp. NMC-1]|uniref:hypothetical protein n=1 Tax=Trichormus sp. NMC-1 TaxID=1853259 RepID=UPI0008DC19FB|nr:hypothetical protein [Trichormus sp. NMC-1]